MSEAAPSSILGKLVKKINIGGKKSKAPDSSGPAPKKKGGEEKLDVPTKKSGGGSGGSKKPVCTKTSIMMIKDINPDPTVGKALGSVPLFLRLSKHEREKLGGALEERTFEEGEMVVEEGGDADTFYIVKEGTASVLKEDPVTGKNVFLLDLTQGDHFGESALLADKDETLNASVRAETFLVVWVLPKVLFLALFKKDRINVTFATRGALDADAPGRGAVDGGGFDPKDQEEIPSLSIGEEALDFILEAIRHNEISQSALFRHFDDRYLLRLARTMALKSYKKGEAIINQGDHGDELFVIMKGEVDVFQTDPEDEKTERQVDHLKADFNKKGHEGKPGSFGELALMHNYARNATVKAACDTNCRILSRRWLNRITYEIVKKKEKNYRDWLAGVELLSPLSNFDRARVAEALMVYNIRTANTLVFKQGDEADGLYIIARGRVTFSAVDSDQRPVELPTPSLGHGKYFGERALLSNKPRAATAIVTDVPCKLLKLNRKAFEDLLGPLKGIMKKTADKYEKKDGGTDVEWKSAGIPFNELHVVGILGRGSYGFVQLVKDTKGKTYALKAISKQRIVDTHQKEHIFNEKRLMMQIDHPFLIKLYDTYKDRDRIYFLLEPSLGGELFPILRRMKTMTPKQAKFYSGQVLLAFEYLHKKDYVYRDLKPENLLLDDNGYIKITDFGFLKKVPHKTYTMCGTPEYMAPEVISHDGHGKAVDFWTLGIFIFEMLASYTPFYRSNQDNLKMYERIVAGHYNFPSHVDKRARYLINGLLQVKPTQRFGVMKSGVNQIKGDKWYEKFDWQGLAWKSLDAPMIPKVKGKYDVSNFKQTVREKVVKPYVDDGTGWDKEF